MRPQKIIYSSRLQALKPHLPLRYGIIFLLKHPEYNRTKLYNFIRGVSFDEVLLCKLENLFKNE
jgi:hypothetical protein